MDLKVVFSREDCMVKLGGFEYMVPKPLGEAIDQLNNKFRHADICSFCGNNMTKHCEHCKGGCHG